jgi:hypothetical protein
MKQNYINLELSGIMGMGAVGPTLAMLTATLYSAVVASMGNPPHWVYPVIMLVLSGLLAVFPAVKAKYSTPLKFALWPIATAIVFAHAYGVNHGLSVGEEVLHGDGGHVSWSFPSFVSSAYAQETNVVVTNRAVVVYSKTNHPAFISGTKVNEVDFSKIDQKTKVKVPASFKKLAPKGVWGFTTKGGLMYLKGKDGEWYGYQPKKKPVLVRPIPEPNSLPMQQQQQMRGGFFKRF